MERQEKDKDRDKEKSSFWGGLFRRSTTLRQPSKKKPQRLPRRETDLDKRRAGPSERRSGLAERTQEEPSRSRRRRQPDQSVLAEPDQDWEPAEPAADIPARSRKSKGKRKVDSPEPSPLKRWPPSGVASDDDLSPHEAGILICKGAPVFKGCKRPVPHAPECFALYAITKGEESDIAPLGGSMTVLMTMRMQSTEAAVYPWETLEQPSYSFYYGYLPGTITLNQWTCMASVLPPAIALRDPGVVPRPIALEDIFERLQELRSGLEDDDLELLYKVLYKRILRDPDRMFSPHKTLDRQITDLILVLSRSDWIDFTNPRNQVVTRFIFDHSAEVEQNIEEREAFNEQYQRFFHQLLLSLELDLRIQSRQHGEWAKEKLLGQIPPRVRWGLALARRWRQNVRVESFGKTPDLIRLRYKLKKRQVKLLKRFATTMKWPNLAETLDNLKAKDNDFALDTISSDSFAYFSGLVVPGPTFPFLIMNTLIDIDPSPATDDLALLSHIHPACGFQYRNSYTYWSSSCIVGKVLAPTCHSLAGWIGPARPTADLSVSQIARIRTRKPRQKLAVEDVESMEERSEPLGPEADRYPVQEYVLHLPDVQDGVDTIRMEMLALRAVATTIPPTDKVISPRVYDATIQFAIDGESWPLRLMYDVTFLSAYPCAEGPHPLFFDYVFTKIRVDEIVGVKDWGGLYGRGGARFGEKDEFEDERVLVVEAWGVRDNEALVRAWCAHWGLGAIVADLRRTCFACAVRQAYAAALTVVILIEGGSYDDDE